MNRLSFSLAAIADVVVPSAGAQEERRSLSVEYVVEVADTARRLFHVTARGMAMRLIMATLVILLAGTGNAGAQTARCELSPRPYGLGGWCHLERGDSAAAKPLRLRFADSVRIWLTAGPADAPPWRGDLSLPGVATSFEIVREEIAPSRHRIVFRTGLAWLLVKEWSEVDAGPRGCSACDRTAVGGRLIIDLVEHPAPTEDDVVILRDALAGLDRSAGWNRAEDQTCTGGESAPMGLFCLLQTAVEARMGRYHHRQPALEIVRSIILQRWRERIAGHPVIDLNNHASTTIDDLRTLLELSLAQARAAN